MALQKFSQDPSEVLDYLVDWTAWLPTGDTIVASAFVVPAGVTAADESFTDKTATVWLSGGTAGRSYTVTNHITTSGGRQGERSFTLQIKDL